MPKNEPTKRAQAAAKRKSAILEAAVTCFILSGYHQTGMRDIAGQAGVSLGNLYNYFAGKADILAEIAAIERAELEPFLEMLAQKAPALEILETFIPAYTKHLATPETVILALEITSEAIREPSVAAMFTESRNALIKALGELLTRGIDEGSLRPSQNVTETAYLVLEVMEGTAFRHGIERVPLKRLLTTQTDFLRAALARG